MRMDLELAGALRARGVCCAAVLVIAGAAQAMPHGHVGTLRYLSAGLAEPGSHSVSNGAIVEAGRAQETALVAVVVSVTGRVQHATMNEEGALTGWADVVVGQRLDAGAWLRSSVRSQAVLRVGVNATVELQSLSRCAIQELAQGDGVLRTRIGVDRGELDLSVDRLEGMTNDFEVRTPTASMAIRGTDLRVGFDALRGAHVTGVSTNKARSIAVRFADGALPTYLASGSLSDVARDPVAVALASATEGERPSVVGTDGVDVTVPTGFVSRSTIQGGHDVSSRATDSAIKASEVGAILVEKGVGGGG